MSSKNKYFVFLVSLFITNLIGCGVSSLPTPNSQAQLVSISITPTNSIIATGTSQQFTAVGTYTDNTTQDLTTSATWISTDTNVAAISSAGMTGAAFNAPGHITIFGRHAGNTIIKVTRGAISGWITLRVTPATLVSIAVTPTNPSIAVGTSQQFTATGTFSDNTTQDLTAAVTWTSAAAVTATISNAAGSNGVATSVAPGSTTVTATMGSVSGSTALTVTPATLVSLSVSPTNPSIALGTVQRFTAMGTYSDNTTQDLTAAVTWTSSAAATATISNAAGFNGVATSATPGSTTITATLGGVSGSTTLTVTPATLVSLSVSPTNPSIALGTVQHFTALGTYSDNTTQDLTKAVAWSSSSTSIATISNAAGSNGVAVSLATGATTITAASGSVSGSTTLTVSPATLVSLAVTPNNPGLPLGSTQHFIATGTFSDSTKQDLTASVTWSSSSTNVATISNAAGSNGVAVAVATGATTITAASGSISGSTALTITAATLVSIAVTPGNPSIANGATQMFTATGSFSNNTTQDITASVTWSSGTAGVATISNAAGSNGLATAVGVGTTIITCVSGNVSAAATLSVTGTGVATLSWDAPTTRTDGSSLNPVTDISGYKIYYGTASGTYTQVVNVTNPGTATITQTLNLPSGTYYFVVTDIDTSGQESSYSNEAMKTL